MLKASRRHELGVLPPSRTASRALSGEGCFYRYPFMYWATVREASLQC